MDALPTRVSDSELFFFSLFVQAYSYHVLSDALSLFVGLMSYLAHHNHSSSSDDDGDDDSKSSVTNTYGWVRVELVGSLISHVAIISLCFR